MLPILDTFPDITGLHNVVKYAEIFLAVDPPLEWPVLGCSDKTPRGVLTYRAKPKLHGTNAAVLISPTGEIAAQSRTQIISPTSDNCGFCKWMLAKEEYWKSLRTVSQIAIFGEWCGPGIMKGTAVNQLPHKIFAVFAIIYDGRLISDPRRIAAYLNTGNMPADVHVLPYVGYTYTADFNDRTGLQALADQLNQVVAAAEPCDPWIKETFGVAGLAEGFVYYPTLPDADWPRKVFSEFAFKAKGEKHKVVKTREAVQIDPEVAASIDAFVELTVTEPRLEQGLAAVGLDIKKTGAFLKWLNGDVVKETQDELEAADLTWDDVQAAVGKKARDWYIAKCKQI